MELDRERRLRERLEFVRFYARWVKSVPNEVWSKQQAVLIESFLESARNFALGPDEYLRMVSFRERRVAEAEARLKGVRLPEESANECSRSSGSQGGSCGAGQAA
jgi:hypothetical protein